MFGGLIIQEVFGDKQRHLYEKGTWARLPFYASTLVGITTVCHQIRAETRLIPLQLNEFRFRNLVFKPSMLYKLTPQQLSSITSIRISLADVCFITNDYSRLQNTRRITVQMSPSVRDYVSISAIERYVRHVLDLSFPKEHEVIFE